MGSVAEQIPVTLFDYTFAPNAQKARNLLNACGIKWVSSEQPFVQPRPTIQDLGITYRRIPVNAIGKDVYCDNRIFLQAVQEIFPDKALPTTPADHAYEAFGYRSFWICLPLVPASLLSKDLQNDRKNLFSVFSRPDFADLRPGALAEFKQFVDIVENDFLSAGGPWINGDKVGVADIHAMWMIKWAIQTLDIGKEPGLGREDFPKFYKWIEGLPTHNDETNPPEKVSPEEAHKRVLQSDYAAKEIGVDELDPSGLKKGQKVAVHTTDDDVPKNMDQVGELVGLGRREVVIQLENGIRVHFPRIGYAVRAV